MKQKVRLNKKTNFLFAVISAPLNHQKTTILAASRVRRNPISFHQQASFPNPKGRKLPTQIQILIYS